MTTHVGVVIGRFQVDEIHAGHLRLLGHVQGKHPSMLILLGCRQSPQTKNNPLEFTPRSQMLRSVFPKAIILPVWDCESDKQWSEQVDSTIRNIFPNRKAVLYGGRKSFIEHYKGKFPCHNMDFYQTTSGTAIRKLISAFPEDDPAFRRGIIFSLMNLQPRIFPTVDIAVVRTIRVDDPFTPDDFISTKEVLLGRKKNAELWRLPGGFWDLSDATAEIAAARELQEETGLTASNLQYLTSQTIDDWRSRDTDDVGHKTLLFLVTEFKGEAKGNDDLPEVKWFPINKYTLPLVTPEHHNLFKEICNHYDFYNLAVSSEGKP